MKNLLDVTKGYSAVLKTAEDAQQKLANNAVFDKERETMSKTVEVAEQLKNKIQTLGAGVGEDILKMKPTIANVQKAEAEIQKLIALQKEMGDNGHLLNDAIQNAQEGMAELGNKAMQAKIETQMLKSVLMGINTMPFMVMSTLLADIIKGTKEFASTFNPTMMRSIAVTGAFVIALGLAFTKMTALGVSTSYFKGLWQSSVIYQGLAGVITMLNTVLGTQLAINAATMVWVGLATLGIGAVIALIATMVMSWDSNSAAIKESEERMKALEDSVQKNIDRWKELGGVAKNALESLMTPAQKLVHKLNELNGAFRTPGEILKEKHGLVIRQAEVKKQIDANPGFWATPESTKQLKQEYVAIEKRIRELDDLLKKRCI